MMRIDGKPQRVKVCVKCGRSLPAKLTFPKRASVKWFVREFDPATGKTRDHACDSKESADEFIRRKERDFTRDPIKAELIEYTSVLVRQIQADTREDAINLLIEKLGGDASHRKLKPVGWQEAVDIVCDELRQKGKSEHYIADLSRVAADLSTITGLSDWPQIDLDAIAKYRSVRMNGGWKRNGRTIKAVRGRAINKDLATLGAFLSRAVRKRWIAANVLHGATDERIKVKPIRVEYLPDEDLQALINAADEAWMRALILVAYYTGGRRSDLLALEWDRDIDLDGSRSRAEGRAGPHIFIRGDKADTPHWMPIHPAAVQALATLRQQPVINNRVFPVRGVRDPGSYVSHLFSQVCINAKLTKEIETDSGSKVTNRWTLHHLRKKANTDLRNRGASRKERMALIGHNSDAVSEAHYEAIQPERERQLIDSLPAFGIAV